VQQRIALGQQLPSSRIIALGRLAQRIGDADLLIDVVVRVRGDLVQRILDAGDVAAIIERILGAIAATVEHNLLAVRRVMRQRDAAAAGVELADDATGADQQQHGYAQPSQTSADN